MNGNFLDRNVAEFLDRNLGNWAAISLIGTLPNSLIGILPKANSKGIRQTGKSPALPVVSGNWLTTSVDVGQARSDLLDRYLFVEVEIEGNEKCVNLGIRIGRCSHSHLVTPSGGG